MTVTAERTAIDAARDVVAALGDRVAAAYVVGSVAMNGFVPGSSDLDVVAVLDERPARDELDLLVERVRELDFAPARGVELVLYVDGDVVLNLNTGPGMVERVDYALPEDSFWFVIDRAIAQQHAVPLVGPAWSECFEPVARDELLDALDASLDTVGAVNVARTWAWLETGNWVAKPAAEQWLRDRVRAAIGAAR